MPDEDDEFGNLCCPECGEIQDAFEVYTENRGAEGDSRCLACGSAIPDDEWITD